MKFFKNFFLMVIPVKLNLDGIFCDELFRYGSDILQQTKKYKTTRRSDQLELFDKDISDIDKIKKAIKTMKMPYDKQGNEIHVQKSVYFEEFYIHDICIRFNFKSSPIMFREVSMNSTYLKHPLVQFFIVLLSNLKNVNIKFKRCFLQQ